MSKPKPIYSERLQMLLNRCDRFKARKKAEAEAQSPAESSDGNPPTESTPNRPNRPDYD